MHPEPAAIYIVLIPIVWAGPIIWFSRRLFSRQTHFPPVYRFSMAKTKRIITILLRLLAFAATLSATVVMVTSHDSAEVLNLKFSAKYSNSPAFKFYVIAEAIASGYGLIALFLSSKSWVNRVIVMLDVVIAMLLTSSISTALAEAVIGKRGNSHAGWLPICGQVPKFCDHVTGALIAGFAAAILYLVLNLYSLYVVLAPLFPLKP